MVYVLDQNGQPLMPTSRHGKVRRMLQSGRAKVVNRCPFTIQLNYESGHQTQEISLGIDAGSQHIGVSATTKVKVLYEAEVELRNDIVDLFEACIDGTLDQVDLQFEDNAAVCVVPVSYTHLTLPTKLEV